jgi:hypothetical protein
MPEGIDGEPGAFGDELGVEKLALPNLGADQFAPALGLLGDPRGSDCCRAPDERAQNRG